MNKCTFFSILISLLFLNAASFGQARTTVQDGPWDNPLTWGGVAPPTSSVGVITVNHNVTIDAPAYPISTPLLVDQLTVGTTGSLTVTSGAALRIRNGSGVDLTVNTPGLFTVASGAEFFINRSSAFNTSATNAIFQSGSVVRTAAANLPLATGLDAIDIHIQDIVNTSLALNATWSQLGANTNLYVNCPDLANRVINFGGFITVLNTLEITDTDGTIGGRVVLNNLGTSALSVGSGGVNVLGDSRLFLTTTGNVTLTLASDFTFNSTSTNFSQNANSGTGVINFNGGDFIMSNGLWRIVGGGSNGTGTFNFDGPGTDMLVTGGVISENGGGTAQGTFSFNDATGNQTLTWIPSAIGTGTLNLVVDKSGTDLNLTSDFITSSTTITSGTLVTNGNDLTISGALTVGTGQIDATTPATFLTINGSGTLPASIPFVPGSVLSNLSFNRTGASLSMPNVSMANGALVTLTAGSITSSLGALGVYDVLYNNTAALSSGSEIPVAPGTLRNLSKTGNGSVTLTSSPSINGDLTISAGSIAAGSNSVSVEGDFINNGSFTQGAGATFTFLTTTPHALSGTSNATFGALVVNGDLTVSNVISTLLGDLTINISSSLNATSGTFAFNGGPHLITDNGTSIQFHAVNIGTGASMTAPLNGTLSIASNFLGNGTFVSNGSTTIFNGTTILSGSSKVFNNITVSNSSSFSGAGSFTILSDLVNNGTISFTGGTMTWDSNGTFSGASPAALNTIVIPSGRTLNLTLTGDLSLLGDLNMTGDINHTSTNNVNIGDDMVGNGNLSSAGTITFTGLTSAMSGAGLKDFNNLAVTGTLTVSGGVSYSITNGSLDVTGTMTTTNGGGIVTINGNTSVISTGISTTLNSLLINGTLNATGNLNLLRNFTNNGTFNAGTGTVSFSGTINQSIQGSAVTTFNNININNGAFFVNVQSNQNLKGILTLGPGSKFDADGTASTSVFTLLSSSSLPVQDGAIAAIPDDATFNGNVTIQRFMENGGTINRYISSPIIGMAVSQLDFPTTNSSIRFYDETVGGAATGGYKTLPLTGSFETGRGYFAYMFNAGDVTWDVTGSIHKGSIALPVSYTASSGGPNSDGWNIVGNPYPSGIVWESGPGWSLTNIDPIISVTDLSSGSGYPNYYHTSNFNDNSGDLPNDFIAMGQAFWVHANAANPSLTVHESAKNPAIGGDFYRKSSSPSEQLIIAINNGKFQDRSFLKLNADATDGYDKKFDGYKFKNEEMNLYLIDNEQRSLVMHTLSDISPEAMIPLGIEVIKSGEYEITFSNVEAFSRSADLFLIDRLDEKITPVSAGKSYTFTIHETSKPITDRFYLSRNTTLSERKLADWLQAYPNPVKDELTIALPAGETAQVTLMDAKGHTLWSDQIKGEGKVDFRGYSSGLYLLRVFNGTEVITRKILK